MTVTTKSNLAATIVDETRCSKAAADRAVEAIIAQMIATIAGGWRSPPRRLRPVHLASQGARPGRNPRTGEAMQIVAKTKPSFRASKPFVDALNGR